MTTAPKTRAELVELLTGVQVTLPQTWANQMKDARALLEHLEACGVVCVPVEADKAETQAAMGELHNNGKPLWAVLRDHKLDASTYWSCRRAMLSASPYANPETKG